MTKHRNTDPPFAYVVVAITLVPRVLSFQTVLVLYWLLILKETRVPSLRTRDKLGLYSRRVNTKVSTRILGRLTAPFPPFHITHRVPHGYTQYPSTDVARGQVRA